MGDIPKELVENLMKEWYKHKFLHHDHRGIGSYRRQKIIDELKIEFTKSEAWQVVMGKDDEERKECFAMVGTKKQIEDMSQEYLYSFFEIVKFIKKFPRKSLCVLLGFNLWENGEITNEETVKILEVSKQN